MRKVEFNSFLLQLEYDEIFLETFKYDLFWDNSKWDYCREKYNLSFGNLSCIVKHFKLYVPESIKAIKREATNLKLFGVTNVSYSEKILTKKKENTKIKYGVEYTFQVPEVVDKISQTKLERYGSASYNNIEKAHFTCLEKYGSNYYMGSVEFKEKTQQSKLKRYGNKNYNNRTKAIKTTIKKYGVINVSQMPEVARRKVKKCIAIDGTVLDSMWEVYVYNFFINQGLKVERQFPIKYIYNNKQHVTLIDFKIDNILFEVKGNHLLEGCFSNKLEVPITKKLEIYKTNDVVIISKESRVFDDINLRGIDVDLFKNDCDWEQLLYSLNNYTKFIKYERLE